MPSSPLSKIKVAADAKALVQQALAHATSATARTRIEAALADAAGQNADRYLTAAEAKVVVDAFEAMTDAPPGSLSGDPINGALADAASRIESMASLSNVDGVSVHFSAKESLAAKLISELQDTVAKAAGRPAEIDMMIFEFQSDAIEGAIVELARANPNVTFRILADSTQASRYGGNALPSILDEGLANVEVKFKKDFPYAWDKKKQRPVYNHNLTQGLNHHKGFVSVIDGQVDRVVTGSFNWSNTADTKNYEDLVVMNGVDSATRRAGEQYVDEFAGFFNSDTTLSPNDFSNFRNQAWNELVAAHGGTPDAFTPLPSDAYAAYTPAINATGFDLNGFRTEDIERLNALVGKTLAGRIRSERSRYGRFASLEELKARVSGVADLDAEVLAQLEARAQFGSNTVSINTASVAELDNAGLSKASAQAIVAYREAHGDFENVEGLLDIPGITSNKLNFARKYLGDDDVEAFFNSRAFGDSNGGTGYGAASSVRTTPAMGADGEVAAVQASVTVAATDLFQRAQPGQTIDVAMYGMSTTAPEYLALVGAAKRGVAVRVVLNDDYTESTVKAIKALRAQGLPIDVRVQTARTMHEKFGVVGDDVFFGSANFSESSSTKHSEDRFAIKNQDEVALGFRAEFEELWAKSKVR